MSEAEKLLLKRLRTGVNTRDTGSYKFYNRGVWDRPEDFDIKIGKPERYNLSKYDRFLRQFKYAEAFENALRTKHSSVILSIIEELLIRDGLEIAIKGLESTDLILLLDFIAKKLDSWKSQSTVNHLLNTLIDVRGNHINENQELRERLKRVSKRLERELRNAELAGEVSTLLTSIKNN